MPLNTIKLEQDLLDLQEKMSQQEDAPAAAKLWAQAISVILTAFVQSGTVSTMGTAAAQTGTIK